MKRISKISGLKKWCTIILINISFILNGQTNNILMFVSHEDTYYSEYIVMLRALQAAGYTVDVRSASTMSFSTYMLPSGTDIVATANTLPGSSYSQFTSQFQNLFGSVWNTSWDPTPTNYIGTNGRIQDVVDMSNYDALVVAGGTGILEYRLDGTYNSQGAGPRLISSATVQAAAQKLNDLAVNALINGKPVLGQCHGASLPVFWRVPATSGPGAESLGFSILKNTLAAGYPDAATAPAYATLSVILRPDDKVTVATPHTSLPHNGNGDFKIITSRDWYPQTVAHAARTLLNILQSYPNKTQREQNLNVLILHGGALDSLNCSPGNLANDIPCNYGSTPNFPADYTFIQNLFNGNSAYDNYSLTVNQLNLTGTLPYTPTSSVSIYNYLNQYDVVVFYKHWSTGISNELQNALRTYADNGGGILALHHGLYNHINGANNKNILVNQIFGVESAMATWSGALANYNLFSTNYGHFISTYGIDYNTPLLAPSAWTTNTLFPVANNTFSYLQRFGVYDEIYNNMSFVSGQTFGRGVNQINPIFSNDAVPASQCHTSGFVKLFNPTADASVGRVAFFQTGERRENFMLNTRFGQVVRNAIVWLANGTGNVSTGIESMSSNNLPILLYPNPAKETITIESENLTPDMVIKVYNTTGVLVSEQNIELSNKIINIKTLPQAVYFLTIEKNKTTVYRTKFIKE
ncbi:MAG: T9SS type A sorting domain-containing protein [Bacteroidetes bacterium]|nr:T9SS type A sorting domain-containing protein [Bacteroidota bacterium]